MISRILIVLVLLLSFKSFSKTQAEMNKVAYANFEKADIELDNIGKDDFCKESLRVKSQIDSLTNDTIKLEEIDQRYIQKLTIEKDSLIWINANMRLDHRIFGYKRPDKNSRKMILFSIFTNEVKDNPFNCKYGSFYDTNGMKDIELKYLSSNGDFIKVGLFNNSLKIDEVFMEKYWFELE